MRQEHDLSHTREAILQWYMHGETGASSKAIAQAALGEKRTEMKHPNDPADLRRCLLLLERIPEAQEAAFRELATRSAGWSAGWEELIRIWPELEATLREEIGTELPARGSAPRTYMMMKEALHRAQEKRKKRISTQE